MNSLRRSVIFQFILIFWPGTALLSSELAAAETAYITTTDAELRKGPGAKYPVIRTIPRDTKVNVVGKESSWLKVESKFGRETGYIDGQNARPIAAPARSRTFAGYLAQLGCATSRLFKSRLALRAINWKSFALASCKRASR